jgi:hypothetical protein
VANAAWLMDKSRMQRTCAGGGELRHGARRQQARKVKALLAEEGRRRRRSCRLTFSTHQACVRRHTVCRAQRGPLARLWQRDVPPLRYRKTLLMQKKLPVIWRSLHQPAEH